MRLASMATQALSSAKSLTAMMALEPVVLLYLLPWVCWPNNNLVPDLRDVLVHTITYIANTRWVKR